MYASKLFLRIAINSAVGVVLVIIWLQFVNLRQIWEVISKVEFFKLIPVILFLLASPGLRAIRFKLLINPIKKVPTMDMILINGLAMLLNFYIPIRGGEIAKGVILSKSYNLPLGKSVIWVFVDRFLDFLIVLVLTTTLFFIVPTALNITFLMIVIFILATAILITYLLAYQVNSSKKIIKFLIPLLILNGIKIYFERFCYLLLETFSILKRNPLELLLLSMVTILAYAADAGGWYFTFLALNSHQSFISIYLAQMLSALTYLIPAAPGYVGSAEASGLLILSGVFGISTNLASAMTVLFHIASAVFVLVFGLFSVFNLKIDLGLILRKAFKKSE